jgi:ABC-2 type transport system permease protein
MILHIYTIWLREMKRFLRSKSRILGNISMPFIWLAIMGVGLNSSFSSPGTSSNYLEFIVPGIIGMSLLFTSIFSGMSVIWERKFGFLKEVLVSPTNRISIVIGKALGTATIAIFTGLIIIALSILIGALNMNNLNLYSFSMTIVFMLLISISFVSFGLAIASKLDNTEGFQMIMSFLVMPMFFLSGAFFPIESAPPWMQGMAFIDPLFYGVDGMRGLLLNASQFPIFFDLSVLVVFSVVLTSISAFLFNKMDL